MHEQPQAVFRRQHGSFSRCARETAWSLLALVVGWEEVTRLLPSYLMLEENSSRVLNGVGPWALSYTPSMHLLPHFKQLHKWGSVPSRPACPSM